MIIWIIGWLLAVGIAIANSSQIKDAGLSIAQQVILVFALFVAWPIALGWAIGKGISVKVNVDQIPKPCKCGPRGGDSKAGAGPAARTEPKQQTPVVPAEETPFVPPAHDDGTASHATA